MLLFFSFLSEYLLNAVCSRSGDRRAHKELGIYSKWEVLGDEGSNGAEAFLKAHSDFCDEKQSIGGKGERRYISTKVAIEFKIRYDGGLQEGGRGEREEGMAGQKYLLMLWMACFFSAPTIMSKQFEGKA